MEPVAAQLDTQPDVFEECVVVKALRAMTLSSALPELHLRRLPNARSWSVVPQPVPVGDNADRHGRLNLRRLLSSGKLPTAGALVHEHFVPIRTAKIHATFREEPLFCDAAHADYHYTHGPL